MAARKQKRRLSDSCRHLQETTTVPVRFHEVDATQVVWHGHYIAYFEFARIAFGRRWGLSYSDFMNNQVVAPLVQVSVDYLAPARMNDDLEVTARLCEMEGAKLAFEYEVTRASDGALLATGSSLQVFTTPHGTLVLTRPDFLVERYKAMEDAWNPPRKKTIE